MSLPVVQTTALQSAPGETDPRPRFGIGHVTVPSSNVAALRDFYTEVGLRLVVDMGQTVILELRGGTHIVVHPGQSGTSSLDFIVDDIDETWEIVGQAGATVTEIKRGHPHDSFGAIDPDGNQLSIHSNHAMGPV